MVFPDVFGPDIAEINMLTFSLPVFTMIPVETVTNAPNALPAQS